MVRRSSRCAAFALASVTALVPIRSVALSVTPMSLAEAVGAAECIVHGTVSEVRSGRDERGLPATWVTLRVARMLKGGSARELRFKQFGLAAPEATGALPMPFLPRYRQGAEMVLLLRRPSRHGFTSPVDPALGAYAVAGGPETGGAGAHAGLDAAARDDLLRALAELIEAQR